MTLENDHLVTFEMLMEHLAALSPDQRTGETLHLASVLIETAAYDHAQIAPGEDVVQMILLAANVAKVAARHGAICETEDAARA